MGHLFSSFQYTVDRKQMFNIWINFCRWLDLNLGPLVLEATALPTDPQPLPVLIPLPTQKYNCTGVIKLTYSNSNNVKNRENVRNTSKGKISETSVTRWLNYVKVFGHLQQWKLAQRKNIFPVVGSKFCQVLNKPSKNCPIIKIVPKRWNFAKSGHTVSDLLYYKEWKCPYIFNHCRRCHWFKWREKKRKWFGIGKSLLTHTYP